MSVISSLPVTRYMVASEMSQIEDWVIEKFKHEDQYHLDLPFSFSYGEQPSHQLLKNWDLQRYTEQLDEHRTENKLIYTDPVTGLVLSCLMVEYQPLPHCRMDTLLPKHRFGEHTNHSKHPSVRH